MIDDQIRDIIRHSLGLSQADKPYRRYYCSDPTPALTAAVERGLMTGPIDRDSMIAPYWLVTEAGAQSVGHTLPASHSSRPT